MVTYGDAVGDIDVDSLLACHKKSGKLATISVYNFGQSKGVVEVGNDGLVNAFREKSNLDGDLINSFPIH
jgi:glucose-1-phosphate cytidylyltransferase